MSKRLDGGGGSPRSKAGPPKPEDDSMVAPPILKTVEGVAKLILGFAAGVLLLYAIHKSWQTGAKIPDRTIYLLGTFIFAFLGVDIWAILRRARDGPNR